MSALEAALNDPSLRVRLGAARAAPALAPDDAAAILQDHADRRGESLSAVETAVIALAITMARGNAVPLLAGLLHENKDRIIAAISQGYEA